MSCNKRPNIGSTKNYVLYSTTCAVLGFLHDIKQFKQIIDDVVSKSYLVSAASLGLPRAPIALFYYKMDALNTRTCTNNIQAD